MKKTLTLAAVLALAGSLSAQTTALDFTANDCDGVNHNLFAELEAGNTIILELVMMGCQPCVTAAESLYDNVLPNVSDPTRVKMYSIGFSNSVTCAQMNNWKSTNGFTHTVFAGMSAQTTHYGGMGMPTIAVIGGGSTHAVYYSEQGHSDSDNPAILAAIEASLADAVGVNEANTEQVGVSPNPATDVLNIAGAKWTKATILDLQGREVLTAPVFAGKLDVTSLPAGAYILRMSDRAGNQGTARFERR